MKKILCMGSLTMDMMMRLPHFPAPGETVKTDHFTKNPGGKGNNQAVTAAKLGASVRFFTKLGTDANSVELTQAQKAWGIDTDYMLVDPQLMAGVAMVEVNADGQNACAFYPGSCLDLKPQEVWDNRRAFEGCDILLISLEMQRPTVYAAIRQAHEMGMTVILDPSPISAEPIPQEIAAMVDFVKPNETETQVITGTSVDCESSAQQALKMLESWGFQHPIVTLGERGCMIRLDGQAQLVPALKLNSVDTTAAGDVFLGSLAFCLANSKSIKYSVEFATKAAGLCTTKYGAQASIPALDEVLSLIKED